MAWDDTARTDYDPDDAVTTTRATQLVTRDKYLGELPFALDFVEATTSATSYTSMVTFVIWVPDYAAGWNLKCIIEVKVATGATGPSASGDWKLYNSTRAVDGTAVTGVTGTSYANSAEGTMAIVEADVGVRTTFGIKGQINDAANTFYIRNEPSITYSRLTFWFEAA